MTAPVPASPPPTTPVPMPPPPPLMLARQPEQAPEAALAEGFARALQRWALAQGAPVVAAAAARAAGRALSLATSAGHACLALGELDALARVATEPQQGLVDHADTGTGTGTDADSDTDTDIDTESTSASADLLAGSAGGPLATAVALPTTLPAWRAALAASGVVGPAHQPGSHPLVLDADDRLYLHRYFDLEQRLACRLARCVARPAPPVDDADTAEAADALARAATLLGTLFCANAAAVGASGDAAPLPPVDWQQIAAALALRNRLTVISGGPGTGKTTTVANLLACLLTLQPDARIVLAAPTGKAAARLAEALRGRAAHLSADVRARLPVESFTLHRLLGVRPAGAASGGGGGGGGGGGWGDEGGDGGFVHHAGNPLALDVLVVDEASMLDLALATRLLEAVPDSARIILLGDKDQLAAVESGAVFAELSADPSLSPACRTQLGALCGVAPARIQPAAPARASALRDSVVWFDRNFRFAADSGIGRLAADTVAGRADAALAWLREGGDASVRWLDDSGAAPLPATLATITAGYAPYLAALRQSQAEPGAAGRLTEIYEAFNAFRVLCAVHDGPRGVAAINQAVSRQFQQALHTPVGAAVDSRSPWFAGRPVMVLRNDPGLRLFNGDIGITLPAAAGWGAGLGAGLGAGSADSAAGSGLMVYFPAADGGFRAVAPVRLPACQTAFAMTVHKSQGSEFDHVCLVLPDRAVAVLTRELLYTGITRAKNRLTLVVSAVDILQLSVCRRVLRNGGLISS